MSLFELPLRVARIGVYLMALCPPHMSRSVRRGLVPVAVSVCCPCPCQKIRSRMTCRGWASPVAINFCGHGSSILWLKSMEETSDDSWTLLLGGLVSVGASIMLSYDV